VSWFREAPFRDFEGYNRVRLNKFAYLRVRLVMAAAQLLVVQLLLELGELLLLLRVDLLLIVLGVDVPLLVL